MCYLRITGLANQLPYNNPLTKKLSQKKTMFGSSLLPLFVSLMYGGNFHVALDQEIPEFFESEVPDDEFVDEDEIRILEIAVMLYIQDHEDSFRINLENNDVGHVESACRIYGIEFEVEREVSPAFMSLALRELKNSVLWGRIRLYLHDENFADSILGYRRIHMNTDVLLLILRSLTPSAFFLLTAMESLKVEYSIDEEGNDIEVPLDTDENMLVELVFYRFMQQFEIQMWVDFKFQELDG